MKISELKEYQKVNRPLKDEFGNRVYEEIEFEKPYDPSEKSLNIRLFAKLLDIAFVVFIQWLISKTGLVFTDKLLFEFLFFIILLLATSSIMESTIGSSFGKLIFNLEVVNDNCKKLNLLKAFYKNVISFGVVSTLLLSQVITSFADFYTNWLKKNSIYVIRRTEKKIIKKMIAEQAVLNTV